MGAALAGREQAGLLRNRIATDGASGGRLQVAGRDYLNFSANDYIELKIYNSTPGTAGVIDAAVQARKVDKAG